MENVQITSGSEKQNIWATDIANKWIAELNQEIETVKIRNESGDRLEKYLELLETASTNLITGISKLTAKQIIDYHQAKRNPAAGLIKQAGEQYNAQKKGV